MKLRSKSAYAIAMAIPFISFCGDSKANTQNLGENQLFFRYKETESLQFANEIKNKNFNFSNFLIAEDTTQIKENKDNKEKRPMVIKTS